MAKIGNVRESLYPGGEEYARFRGSKHEGKEHLKFWMFFFIWSLHQFCCCRRWEWLRIWTKLYLCICVFADGNDWGDDERHIGRSPHWVGWWGGAGCHCKPGWLFLFLHLHLNLYFHLYLYLYLQLYLYLNLYFHLYLYLYIYHFKVLDEIGIEVSGKVNK